MKISNLSHRAAGSRPLKRHLVFIVLIGLSLGLSASPQARAQHERWERSIQRFERADAVAMPPADGILFVGSSSIVGWKLDEWFPGLPTLNRGFGGSIVSDLNHYFDRLVPVYRPKTIVLYSGDNDVASGIPTETIVAEYTTFLQKVNSTLPDATVILIAVKPSPARWSHWPAMQAVNTRLSSLAAADPKITFLDVSVDMLGADGQPTQDIFIEDGLHMNTDGYRRWTALLRPLLQKGRSQRSPEQHAMAVLDDFMTAFNARNERAWTETMHFPHVRFASGQTTIDVSAEAMEDTFDFDTFAKRFGWSHSAWTARKIVQSGPNKVHVSTRFARYRKDGSVLAEFDSLYIVVQRDGRWGVVSRSSFAP